MNSRSVEMLNSQELELHDKHYHVEVSSPDPEDDIQIEVFNKQRNSEAMFYADRGSARELAIALLEAANE